MPKDPKDLMLLASQVNGLRGINRPWHVKANYQTFDADGKPKDQGTFEEWWAASDKFKISYAGKEFSQIEYRNRAKDLVTGDPGLPRLPLEMVKELLVNPLPRPSLIQKRSYSAKEIKIGTSKLDCIQPVPPSAVLSGGLEDYCFSAGTLAIRFDSFAADIYVVFNKLAMTDGHYVANRIAVQNSNLPIMNATLASIEFPSEIDDAVIEPLGTVTPASPLVVNPDVIAGRSIGGEFPRYPLVAQQNRVQGTVMLDAIITKAGIIGELYVVSGPKALQGSALEAVKTWKFKPYLPNREPVEYRTQIYVVYRVGSRVLGGDLPMMGH